MCGALGGVRERVSLCPGVRESLCVAADKEGERPRRSNSFSCLVESHGLEQLTNLYVKSGLDLCIPLSCHCICLSRLCGMIGILRAGARSLHLKFLLPPAASTATSTLRIEPGTLRPVRPNLRLSLPGPPS